MTHRKTAEIKSGDNTFAAYRQNVDCCETIIIIVYFCCFDVPLCR